MSSTPIPSRTDTYYSDICLVLVLQDGDVPVDPLKGRRGGDNVSEANIIGNLRALPDESYPRVRLSICSSTSVPTKVAQTTLTGSFMSLGPFVAMTYMLTIGSMLRRLRAIAGRGKVTLATFATAQAQVDIVCVIAISTHSFHSSFTNRNVYLWC